MRSVLVDLGRGIVVGLGVLLAAAPAGAQPDRKVRPAAPQPTGDVHQMVIQNGTNRTVHYFANSNVSPGDAATLHDLERAENELSYVQNLQALRREYVHSERILEKERRYVQSQLYGRSVSASGTGPFAFSTSFGGRFGVGAGYPLGFPYNYGGWGYGGLGAMIGGGGFSETQNLAYGTGYEGPIKEAVAQSIARQATPEYTAAVYRDYGTAVARAANSPPLRDALALRAPGGGARPGAAQPAAFGEMMPGTTFRVGQPATLTLRGNRTIDGTVVNEDADWVTLEKGDTITNVRKSEIVSGEQKKQAPK